MRKITVALSGLLGVLAVGGLAGAEPVRPAFHEEMGRVVDEVTQGLRSLGAQLEQHLHHGPGGPRGPGMTGPGGPSPAERPLITIMLHHRTELGLTPEQVSRLEALRGEFAREAIRREADLRIAELDLAGLLAQEPLEMARVEAKVREAAQLQADLRIARLRTLEQGKAVLTPEQRARLGSLLGGGDMPGPRRAAATGARL